MANDYINKIQLPNGATYDLQDSTALHSTTLVTVEQGGTGVSSIDNIRAGKDGNGNTISSTYLKLSGGTTSGEIILKRSTGPSVPLSFGTFASDIGSTPITVDASWLKIIGDCSRNSNESLQSSRFIFREFSPVRATGAISEKREDYCLPYADFDLSSSKTYDILTTKSPVTIEQGGTNATTKKTALENLGGTFNITLGDNDNSWGAIYEKLSTIPLYSTSTICIRASVTNLITGQTISKLLYGVVETNANGAYNFSCSAYDTINSYSWKITGLTSASATPTIEYFYKIVNPTNGIPAVENGGTGVSSIAEIRAGKDGSGNTISSTYLKLSGGTLTGNLSITRSAAFQPRLSFKTSADVTLSSGSLINAEWFYILGVCPTFTNNIPNDSYLQFRQYSPSQNSATIGSYENYNLPVVEKGLATSKNYQILTTKNIITVEQGGTGQTSISNIQAGKDGQGNVISNTYLKLSGGTLTNNLTIHRQGTYSILSFGTDANDGEGTNTYITQNWMQIFGYSPSINNSTGNLTDGYIFFREHSPNSDGSYSGHYENFSLPRVDIDRSSDASYSILTSKNVVTIPQGGTGGGTAKEALAELGAAYSTGNSATWATIYTILSKMQTYSTALIYINDGNTARLLTNTSSSQISSGLFGTVSCAGSNQGVYRFLCRDGNGTYLYAWSISGFTSAAAPTISTVYRFSGTAIT